MQIQQEKCYKIVLIGTNNSGKNQLFNDIFQIQDNQQSNSQGLLQTKTKNIQVQGKNIKLQISNTPGSEQYEILRRSVYKGSQTLIFVMNVAGDQSQEFISQQLEVILKKDLCSYDCSVVLIAFNNGGQENNLHSSEFSTIGGLVGSSYEISINEKQKVFDILENIAIQRLKFDNQDEGAKSFIQKVYENLQHPLMEPFKSILNDKEQNQENPQQENEQAAPGGYYLRPQKQEKVVETKTNLLKCVLIGVSEVGKSCMCQQYADGSFLDTHYPTIGVDFRVSTKTLGNQSYKLQIWDTAGLEKFKTIVSAYYRGMKIAFFIYDVSKFQTFTKLESLISQFDKLNQEPVKYRCIVGNKTDLMRQVSTEEGMEVAQKLGTDFVQVSAKNHDDIEKLFMKSIQFFHQRNKKIQQNQ